MKNAYLASLFLIVFSCSTDHQQSQNNQKQTVSASLHQEQADIEPEIGSQENPINFYLTPSVSEKILTNGAGEIISFLHKETGYHFNVVIPKDYDQMINDFGKDKVDLAIMNSFGYLLANQKYRAKAKLRTLRYGKSTYQGQIIVNADRNITQLKDLEGMSFAFTDSSSTSGFLFPNQMLLDQNVNLGEIQFVTHHDDVVKLVYEGKVDAGATFHSSPSQNGEIRDARIRMINQYPDVEDKVNIIALTEPIPNDPIVFKQSLNESITNKLVFALMKYSFTDEGKKVLGEMYGTEGFVRCSDNDYTNMLEVLEKSGLKPNAFL